MQAFNGHYYDMPTSEYVVRNILTKDEADYLDTYRIPHNAGFEAFSELRRIQLKVTRAIESGKVDKHIVANPVYLGLHVISDYLPGGEMLSHADGKLYTSKKEYYNSVKKNGGYIQEESRYTKLEKPETFNEKKFDQSFKKALEQHGF